LVLTSWGIPVSTTFLILTVFAPQSLDEMLIKSAWGYGLALIAGLVIYQLIYKLENFFLETVNKEPPKIWIILQWLSTGFLWSQWLIQDFANIFAYLPRQLTATWLILSLTMMLLLQTIIFINRGGQIEKIVTSKTNAHDLRSATIINLLYGLILLFFVGYNHIPMSTTWVFLGLLGGREISLNLARENPHLSATVKLVLGDALKALIGMIISVIIALSLPLLTR
jgi:hypothetical protein